MIKQHLLPIPCMTERVGSLKKIIDLFDIGRYQQLLRDYIWRRWRIKKPSSHRFLASHRFLTCHLAHTMPLASTNLLWTCSCQDSNGKLHFFTWTASSFSTKTLSSNLAMCAKFFFCYWATKPLSSSRGANQLLIKPIAVTLYFS